LDAEDEIKGTQGQSMKTHHLRNLFCLLPIWLGSLCFAQLVTIRVIDARNGYPLQKRQASLRLLYGKNEKTPAKYEPTLLLETDDNGEAQFKLPEPAPEHLEAWVGITSEEHWWCGCLLSVLTQDVVQKGIGGSWPGPGSQKSPVSEKAVPGEILFLARPWTLFEKLLAPLLRG
jgi:hypothetical protein